MNLTLRQRAKFNAALCMIHDTGHDASAITRAARSAMSAGADPRTAYERALNGFADSNPDLLPELARVVRLVEASDDDTVAKYDAAISSYIETGDDGAMRALAPMIAQDMTTLAARRGEEPPSFSPEFQAMAAIPPQPETFAFQVGDSDGSPAETVAGRQVVGRAPSGEAIVRTATQISAGGGVTGMVAPKAQRGWAAVPFVGGLSAASPPVNNGTYASAKDAARAAAANSGRAIIAETPGEAA